jgi:hypothetical protein
MGKEERNHSPLEAGCRSWTCPVGQYQIIYIYIYISMNSRWWWNCRPIEVNANSLPKSQNPLRRLKRSLNHRTLPHTPAAPVKMNHPQYFSLPFWHQNGPHHPEASSVPATAHIDHQPHHRTLPRKPSSQNHRYLRCQHVEFKETRERAHKLQTDEILKLKGAPDIKESHLVFASGIIRTAWTTSVEPERLWNGTWNEDTLWRLCIGPDHSSTVKDSITDILNKTKLPKKLPKKFRSDQLPIG